MTGEAKLTFDEYLRLWAREKPDAIALEEWPFAALDAKHGLLRLLTGVGDEVF